MPAFISPLTRWIAIGVVCLSVNSIGNADDWPQWGRDWSHNAVSPEKGAPVDFAFEVRDDKGKTVPAKNIVWSTQLGSRIEGTPVLAVAFVFARPTPHYHPTTDMH